MIDCCCFLLPLGYCSLYTRDGTVCRLTFEKSEIGRINSLQKKAKEELEEYFSGCRRNFDIPLLRTQGTNFQQQVWQAISTIGYGKTQSYKQIAEYINHPQATRAVGGACNRNPLPIFIPCHRVIGSNHKLIGYAGGLRIKEFLLELEQKCL